MDCNPHEWNYADWLPIIRGSDPEAHDSIRCVDCGRELAVVDMTRNMQISIAGALADRLYGGDEKTEIFTSVMDFFQRTAVRVLAEKPVVSSEEIARFREGRR